MAVLHKEESRSVKRSRHIVASTRFFLDLLLPDEGYSFFYVMANPRVIFISWNQQVGLPSLKKKASGLHHDSILSSLINNAPPATNPNNPNLRSKGRYRNTKC